MTPTQIHPDADPVLAIESYGTTPEEKRAVLDIDLNGYGPEANYALWCLANGLVAQDGTPSGLGAL